MSVSATVLFEAKDAETVQTTQYTSSNVVTIIDKFTAVNHGIAIGSLTVNLVALAGAAATTNIIVQAKTLLPGETYLFPEIVGHILTKGNFISTLASAASTISIRASGRTIS